MPRAARGWWCSGELACDGPQWSVVAQNGVSAGHPHRPRERAGQDDLAGLQSGVVLVELVREPRHPDRRVSEDARRDAGLLDLAVAAQHAGNPGEVDLVE